MSKIKGSYVVQKREDLSRPWVSTYSGIRDLSTFDTEDEALDFIRNYTGDKYLGASTMREFRVIRNPSRKHLSGNFVVQKREDLSRPWVSTYSGIHDLSSFDTEDEALDFIRSYSGDTRLSADTMRRYRVIRGKRNGGARGNPSKTHYSVYRDSTGEGYWPVSDGWFPTKKEAQDYIREHKRRDMTPSKYKIVPTDERGRRLNPSEAESISEGFHGRPPSETIDIDEEEQYTEELGVLGCLVELHITRDDGETSVKLRFPIPTDPKFKDGDEVYLAAANKHQMEFVGGDQEIVNLEEIVKHTDKQLVKLGSLDKVVYLTDKYHLDDSDGQEAEYVHELGKKKMFGFSNKRTGRPEVIYDTVNAQLKLVGGTYSITDEGIIN